MAGLKLITKNLAAPNTLVITAGMNITKLSFKMSTANGDNGSYKGDGTVLDSNQISVGGDTIAVGAGEGNTFAVGSASQSLSGITLTSIQGTMRIDLCQS